ncbi:MAG: diaminopimelate epimerase, partial [Tetragenococcus koreensis]
MEIPFYKMQGAANDFIVINNMKLGLSGGQLVS